MVKQMLTPRQLTILKAIVEEFIDTAEPIGSKVLMKKYNLPYSSATIRNEMAILEEIGYLEKTHTSSGRIPSTEGYRFYVGYLLETREKEPLKNQLAPLFTTKGQSLNEIIRESCEMLSELTQLTSVVLGPNAKNDYLQRITIIPLSKQSASVIIVTDKGHVQNKTFRIDEHISMEDLEACVNVMNDYLIGTAIDCVQERLEYEVKPILEKRIIEHEVIFNAFLEAFVKFASSDVYFSGKENMLYQPEFNDVNKIRRLVSAFENSQMWHALSPIEESEGITVKIGADVPIASINTDVSVISASFKTGAESKGMISVIGPTRMPYEKVISLVEYISKNIEAILIIEEDDET